VSPIILTEMDWACGRHRGEERSLQDFVGETSGKEATWRIELQKEG
jgi:hypothetical protein